MRYTGDNQFDHGQTDKVGVLITNLGTPAAPKRADLRRYLKQFLSDPRVVEVPRALWWFILNGVILNIRPGRSAASYRQVWTDAGSPLLLHTQGQARALKDVLQRRHDARVVVDFAMRYGEPAISDALQRLFNEGVRKLVVLPLYPQYSCATTGSTFDAISADFTRRRWLPELVFINQYHDHPDYIAALTSSIIDHRERHGTADKLLFSYHGEPRSYLDKGDPYHCQCHKTSRLVAQQLGLTDSDYMTTFQSRFGRAEWLRPYTDEVLKALPGEGVKRVQVVCPGFSADCLETLEEIDEENRDYFVESGGENFQYIPCLNSTEGHIEALASIVDRHLSEWIDVADDSGGRRERAQALGAGS
ncbi:MAG: ferrochelatase [Pseudomonadota bacterium]